MDKVTTREKALARIKDGQTIMVGGFGLVGVPTSLLAGIIEKGIKDLTVIGNDSGDPADPNDMRPYLITHNLVRKLIVTHIGLNAETGRRMMAGELDVELVPQGTLVERIRCGGSGLGGILTPTGVGTLIEKGKKKIEVAGKVYLLETPLKADVALIKANIADKMGNLIFRRTARNYNLAMAMAADWVIVEAKKIVETGDLDPELISIPGLLVDQIFEI